MTCKSLHILLPTYMSRFFFYSVPPGSTTSIIINYLQSSYCARLFSHLTSWRIALSLSLHLANVYHYFWTSARYSYKISELHWTYVKWTSPVPLSTYVISLWCYSSHHFIFEVCLSLQTTSFSHTILWTLDTGKKYALIVFVFPILLNIPDTY